TQEPEEMDESGFHNGSWSPGVRSITPAPPKTLSEEAYELIRADVIAGRLAPGERLANAAIKRRYSIGGSPMREALTRLAADGLIVGVGQRGFRVVSATPGELADIGRVRLHLELHVLAESIRKGGVDWEAEIVSRYHRLTRAMEERKTAAYADNWEREHRAFHFAILSACGSPWLLHFCDRIYDQTERYRRLFTKYSDIPPCLVEAHGEILETILRRDVKKSVALMKQHIVTATQQTLNDMLKAGVPVDPSIKKAIDKMGG